MQLEQLVGGHPAGEAEELREISERRPGLPRACPRTTHLGVPGRGPHQAARDLDERGLPGAVRPEQTDELAVADLEVDTADRFDRALAERRQELVDRQRGERADLRAAARTEADRDPGYGCGVRRLDDVHEVVVAESRPLV